MVLQQLSLAPRIVRNMNLTYNQINALVRAREGTGLNRQQLGEGIRYAKGKVASGSYLRNLRPNFRPNPQRLRDSQARMTTRFRYEVRIRGRNLQTGQLEDQFVTVRTDRNIPRQEIETEARKAYESAADAQIARYTLSDLEIQLETGAWRGDPEPL